MVDTIAEKMSQASATRQPDPPKKGEKYQCTRCGMEIEVTADCRCRDAEQAHFKCCGQKLARV